MKTNQNMLRKMGDFNITQRTSDGYFDANELLSQWNAVKGNSKREMNKFLRNDGLPAFIEALKDELNKSQKCDKLDFQAVKRTKVKIQGEAGRPKEQVWMHPYLFIKFAMWINPRFEVKVIKFVYDEMIKYRNDAGDAYKDLSSAIMRIVPNDFMPKAMQKVGEAINWIIFNNHEKMIRNKVGDEIKQRDLWQLEKKIADLINEGFITDYTNLINYLRNVYNKRNNPKVFKAA